MPRQKFFRKKSGKKGKTPKTEKKIPGKFSENPDFIVGCFFIIFIHMKLLDTIFEAVSDLFSNREGIMSKGEWNEIDEKNSSENIKKKIKYVRGLSDECRTYAMENHSDWLHDVGSGKVSGLKLHPNLEKKIKDNNLPSGFSMGVDKNGYYIHTHRARSKSNLNPSGFTQKEIKFVDSTG